jgi:hypothetical protein
MTTKWINSADQESAAGFFFMAPEDPLCLTSVGTSVLRTGVSGGSTALSFGSSEPEQPKVMAHAATTNQEHAFRFINAFLNPTLVNAWRDLPRNWKMRNRKRSVR